MKQVGWRDKTPMVDKLAGQLQDAQERITDLESQLAECERQREMHRKANQELDASRTNLIHQMDNADARIDNLERKLAAAREALNAADVLAKRLRKIHDNPEYLSVWEIAQLHNGPYLGPMYDTELALLEDRLAALTEAGEGEKK